jgi:hypothetical protein
MPQDVVQFNIFLYIGLANLKIFKLWKKVQVPLNLPKMVEMKG